MTPHEMKSDEVREIEQKSQQIMGEIRELLERLNRRLAGEAAQPHAWEIAARPN